ncbi:MAG: dimethyl sulfoxide reductase anchor subunit [Burkholderiales bacterium]|nr:dimethyl sulfoxide reductase anchor subunit [Burkholderiales bacterium]MDE2395319.1 dimethyl sulfoxide reductase anchor subunit [Burkholderiales bacterium]MDE2454532.1 dimethyl sulfoxide reductase anchor subunit [Burkholderiales bacterium]
MNPALSVVFLTTLAGSAQGLVLALFAAEWAHRVQWLDGAPGTGLVAAGAFTAALLATAGLVASFFHLGRPERAWRAAMMWRTSWLSREVIVLPGFIALALAYGAVQLVQPDWSFEVGLLASFAALLLFLCTGMIYACIRFLREWATPLTLVNFVLLGSANGFAIAAALAASLGAPTGAFFAFYALGLTVAGFVGRYAAWRRNAALVPKSTLQTAIGIKHHQIRQTSQGFMGGSFNTREFFHGRGPATMAALRRICVFGAFVGPVLLLVAGYALTSAPLYAAAALVQYLGLLAERWLFFAEARHPQNNYYQSMA